MGKIENNLHILRAFTLTVATQRFSLNVWNKTTFCFHIKRHSTIASIYISL
jgi:hypothetical protein